MIFPSQPRLMKVFIFALSLLVLAVCYFCWRWGGADVTSYSVKYSIERWQKDPTKVSVSDIDAALAKTNTMINAWPQRAEYYDLKAKVLWYRAVVAKTLTEANPFLLDAIEMHDHAILLRPQWPYSWSSRSLLKSYVGQLDDDFYLGFDAAAKYGPWEKSSNLMLLEAGLVSWGEIGSRYTSLTVQAAERAAAHDPQSVKVLLKKYGKKYPVCSQMQISPRQTKACS